MKVFGKSQEKEKFKSIQKIKSKRLQTEKKTPIKRLNTTLSVLKQKSPESKIRIKTQALNLHPEP